MMKIIIDLLLIAVIVTLIYDSGFFEVMDDAIQRKFRFHHLPHVFHCVFCGVWWCCLGFTIITGQFSILNTLICITLAKLTDVFIPLIKTIENIFLKIIELINRLIEKL